MHDPGMYCMNSLGDSHCEPASACCAAYFIGCTVEEASPPLFIIMYAAMPPPIRPTPATPPTAAPMMTPLSSELEELAAVVGAAVETVTVMAEIELATTVAMPLKPPSLRTALIAVDRVVAVTLMADVSMPAESAIMASNVTVTARRAFTAEEVTLQPVVYVQELLAQVTIPMSFP